MRIEELNAFYDAWGPDSATHGFDDIAQKLYDGSEGTIGDFNAAIIGRDVKDELTRMAVELLGLMSKAKDAADEVSDISDATSIDGNDVSFAGDVTVDGELYADGNRPVLYYRKTLTNADDLDTVTTAGIYYYASNNRPANAPSTVSTIIFVLSNPSGSRIGQIAIDSVGRMRYRAKLSESAFLDWRHVITDAEMEDALKMDSFIGKVGNNILLANQPSNTVCRLWKIELPASQDTPFDAPPGVDVLKHEGGDNYYAWLYTVGGKNEMQFMFYPHNNRLYYRFRTLLSTDPDTFYWSDWMTEVDDALKLGAFDGVVMKQVYDDITGDPVIDEDTNEPVTVPEKKLGYQRINTFCRLINIQIKTDEQDPDTFDAPTDVDLLLIKEPITPEEWEALPAAEKTKQLAYPEYEEGYIITRKKSYYGWMFTAGGTSNKIQYLFYAHNRALYFRFFRSGGWTTWFKIRENSGGGGGGGVNSLKILCVGNSFNQSALAYLPPILNDILPDYNITYCDLYRSGASFSDHIDMYLNGTAYSDANYWEPGSASWDRQSNRTLVSVLAEGWDLILMQGTSEDLDPDTGVTPMFANARKLLRILQNEAGASRSADPEIPGRKPFAAMWFQWMGRPKGSITSAGMYDKIKDATDKAMNTMGFADFIPVGAAFQIARGNSTFNALGTIHAEYNPNGEMLYSDGKHMNAGIPCLLASYVIALKILEWTGNRGRGVYDSAWIPTEANCVSIGVSNGQGGVKMTHGYSANGGVVVENNAVTTASMDLIRAAQEIAVMAVNAGNLPELNIPTLTLQDIYLDRIDHAAVHDYDSNYNADDPSITILRGYLATLDEDEAHFVVRCLPSAANMIVEAEEPEGE